MWKESLGIIFVISSLFCACTPHFAKVGASNAVSKEETLNAVSKYIVEDMESSTAEIVVIEKNGSVMRCTAFAYKRSNYLYRFITAAHCVAKDDKKNKKVNIFADKINLVIENKKTKIVRTYPAKLIAAGYNGIDDDFAILEADLDQHVPILSLSFGTPILKECVFSVGRKNKSNRNIFYGHVYKLYYARSGSFIVRMLSGEVPNGTSGSAIVSCSSGKIMAIVVAATRKDPKQTIVFPITRFLKFEEKIKNETYKYPPSTKKGNN